MNRTTIDWENLDYTLNPIVGCQNNCTGFECYAKVLHNRRHKAYLAGAKLPIQYAKPFEEIQFFPERLKEPGRVKKPSTIFIGSMCDIHSPGVLPYWLKQVIEMTEKCPQHTFMFLTKLPQYYFLNKYPQNCQLGATVTTSGEMWRAAELRHSPNKVFLSIEPILGSFSGITIPDYIDLVIIGADTSAGAKQPPLEWVESIDHKNIWYKKSLTKILTK